MTYFAGLPRSVLAVVTATSIALLAQTFSAAAMPVVDQEQLLANTGLPFHFSKLHDNLPMGQSFTAGIGGRLDRIDVFSNGQRRESENVTLELREGNGTGGNLLGSIDLVLPVNGVYPVAGHFVDIMDVSSLDVLVTAGTQYSFVFTAAVYGEDGVRGLIGHTGDPYAGGNAFFGGYGTQPSWDMMFRTHVTEVSEPSAVALLAVGLFAAARLRRNS